MADNSKTMVVFSESHILPTIIVPNDSTTASNELLIESVFFPISDIPPFNSDTICVIDISYQLTRLFE